MMKELIQCDLCQSNHFTPLYTIDRYDPPFHITQCQSCDLIFMNPQFTETELQSFYDEGYYKGDNQYSYVDERSIFKGSSFVWKARLRQLMNHLKVYPSSYPQRILDIGCSFGGLLSVAKQMGFEVYGIDVSEYAANYARQSLGETNIKTGVLKPGDFKPESMDCITMVEVAEHLSNPMETFKESYRLLKPGGILLIQTANMDGWQAKKEGSQYHYFLPGHLYYFSKKTLNRYANKIGFRKTKSFYGCEFGLLPKIQKMRFGFSTIRDYTKLFPMIHYHFKSKFHFADWALTSGYVVYFLK